MHAKNLCTCFLVDVLNFVCHGRVWQMWEPPLHNLPHHLGFLTKIRIKDHSKIDASFAVKKHYQRFKFNTIWIGDIAM